jgi:hypothetical protein
VTPSLEERLRRLGAPDDEAAEARASAALRQAAGSGELRRGIPTTVRWGAAAVAALLFGLTPPGQAVAERLGELVGIGDEPTVEQRVDEETGAVVIASGESPSGAPVELVAFRVEAKTGQVDAAVRTCYAFDLPPGPRSTGNCVTEPPAEVGSVRVIAAASPLRPESQLVVQGTTSADTSTVNVTYTDIDGGVYEADTIFGSLTEPLSAEIEADTEAGLFVSFLPQLLRADLITLEREEVEAVAERITVVGRDEDGNELWRAALADLPGGEQVEIPMVPGDSRRFDLPAVSEADTPTPIGSGVSIATGVTGVPTAYAHIGSGGPGAHWLHQCDLLFEGGDSRLGAIGPQNVQMCAMFRAKEAGKLLPGEYSRDELTDILKGADVVPPEYESMIR